MVKVYDPAKVNVIVGTRRLSGFSDNSVVKVTRNDDMWKLEMGVDGEGTRSKSNNRSGKFEISLMQSSQDNEYLSSLAIADENGNAGIVPVTVSDLNGETLYSGASSWIMKYPDSEYGKEASARVWMLETDNLFVNISGY